eukprot:198131_1
MSHFNLDYYIPTIPVFISWICKDVIAFSFFILYAHLYCRGRSELERKDSIVFQRLRLLMMVMSFCDFLWPFRFYFEMPLAFKVLILSLAKLFDLLLCITISILSIRVFSAYYRAKRMNESIHCCEYTVVIIYIIEEIITLIMNILQLSIGNRTYIRNLYMLNSLIWFTTTAVFSITLIIFLFRILTLFKRINGPWTWTTAHPDNTYPQITHCASDSAKILYLKLIWLCTGIVTYYAIILGVHIYLFIEWDIRVMRTLLWFVLTELLGHFTFYVTLWSYLRIDEGSTDVNVKMKHMEHDRCLVEGDGTSHVTQSKNVYDVFSNLCNSKNVMYGKISGTGKRSIIKKKHIQSVDGSECTSDFSTTYENTPYSLTEPVID